MLLLTSVVQSESSGLRLAEVSRSTYGEVHSVWQNRAVMTSLVYVPLQAQVAARRFLVSLLITHTHSFQASRTRDASAFLRDPLGLDFAVLARRIVYCSVSCFLRQ